MAHETTHVATRQRTSAAVPIWLSEGFADYVGYRDAGVPDAVAASDLLTRVRAQGAPAALPTERDFDAARGEVGAAYNGAWLACRMLAERYGERGLVRVYAAAAANGPVGLAMALRALGTDERALLADWRRYLVEQAG
jgi:hypothetical protein